MTPKKAPRTILWCAVAIFAAYVAFYAAGSGFAANGGDVAVFSPSADVEVNSDSVGDVVVVAGNRNTVQRPYAPETEQHQRGELIYLTLLMAAVIGAVWYWWRRVRNGFDFIMVQQKEMK